MMILGIVSAVPANVVKNTDEAFIRMTGVAERRVTLDKTTGDYAALAADHLLRLLKWNPREVGAIVFVTQTPDVRMPATACKLAGDLNMNCAAFDVNLACSGYVYGLWLAHKIGGRVLLIAGDTVSRMCDPADKSTYPLFGDAVTATAIEVPTGIEAIPPIFNLGTDGAGFDSLIADPLIRMAGADVMNFALKSVPKLVADTTMNAHCDWYFFHQANLTMLKHLQKKCGIPDAKFPTNIQTMGNTSSASIPLLMCSSDATIFLRKTRSRACLVGFGAGFSYATCMLDLEPIPVLELVEV